MHAPRLECYLSFNPLEISDYPQETNGGQFIVQLLDNSSPFKVYLSKD